MAPDVGTLDPGWSIVPMEDPLLYAVKVIAILVLLAAVLIIICDPKAAKR